MDLKIINQIQKKDDLLTPTIINNFDINKTVKDLKLEIYDKLNLKGKISLNRIGLFYSSNKDDRKKKDALSEDLKQLLYYDNISNENTIIYVKDIGPQISYKLVYIIEYLGPLLFTFIFFIRLYKVKSSKNENIQTVQLFYFFMSTFHYLKRIFETLFIHIFSRDTMPLKNLYKNCAYYWGLYGILCCYFIFHPNYTPINFLLGFRYIFVFFFFNAEIKNLKCHIILRDLKKYNNGKKAPPPNKDGFEVSTCANYFWEFIAWFCFSVFSLHWSIILFTCCGFYQMREWALKKHKLLKEVYGDRYPKERKAFIPYFI